MGTIKLRGPRQLTVTEWAVLQLVKRASWCGTVSQLAAAVERPERYVWTALGELKERQLVAVARRGEVYVLAATIRGVGRNRR